MSDDALQTDSQPDLVDPAIDFPKDCAALFPDGFRYPEGYFPKTNRLIDPDDLRSFDPLERPYLVRDSKGQMILDSGVPVPVKHVLRPNRDPNLKSVIRYLECEGPPNQPMEVTFACEDRITAAGYLSEAGFHEHALRGINELPVPFQDSEPALRILARSQTALGHFEEALTAVRKLIVNDEITDYSRSLYRIQEANLLLHLGEDSAAEGLLNDRRAELSRMYSYYGVRAAIALRQGDEPLARMLVLKAGVTDAYHAFKILWNPHLAPLRVFIRRELLDEDNKPRLYRQNSEIHLLCHRIQGALLTKGQARVKNLVEGLRLGLITDWSSTFEAAICLVGLGKFDWLDKWSAILPGWHLKSIQFARAVAQSILRPGSKTADELREHFDTESTDEATKMVFEEILPYLTTGIIGKLPDYSELIIADIGDRWRDKGRERTILLKTAEGFRGEVLLQVSPENNCDEPSGLRRHSKPTDIIEFSSASEIEEWLEMKLRETVASGTHPYQRRWFIRLNGWAFLHALNPDAERTPLMAEARSIIQADPNLYFTSPPAAFSLHQSFETRFIAMLLQRLRLDMLCGHNS